MKEIEKSWVLPFPRKIVYAAWVSSETVIPPATSMDVLPEVGGHYRLLMDTEAFQGRNEGEFRQVEPGERVVYTWEWNGDGEVTEIDVRFADAEAGTAVSLKHSGFTSADSVHNHDQGWDSYIEGFQRFLAEQ